MIKLQNTRHNLPQLCVKAASEASVHLACKYLPMPVMNFRQDVCCNQNAYHLEEQIRWMFASHRLSMGNECGLSSPMAVERSIFVTAPPPFKAPSLVWSAPIKYTKYASHCVPFLLVKSCPQRTSATKWPTSWRASSSCELCSLLQGKLK